MDPELMNKIKLKAYEVYEKSGCTEGRDLENWLEAERLILAQRTQRNKQIEQASMTQPEPESCAGCVVW